MFFFFALFCLVIKSCLTLDTLWTIACQALLSMGFFPGKNGGMCCHFLLQGSSWPRDGTHISCVSCIAGGFFIDELPGKPQGSFTSFWYGCLLFLIFLRGLETSVPSSEQVMSLDVTHSQAWAESLYTLTIMYAVNHSYFCRCLLSECGGLFYYWFAEGF